MKMELSFEGISSFFSDFKIDNIGMLIVLCVVIISTTASYIQLFHASQFEAILMNKSEESKRFFSIYVILFFIFVVANYLFTTDGSFCLINVLILVLTLPISLVIKLVSKISKSQKMYLSFREGRDLIILITFTATGIFAVSNMIDINILSLVILGSLIEVLAIAIAVLNTSKIKTVITVKIDGEKWYVFKRIDEEYLLCGDNCMISTSTKTRLLEIADFVEGNICFEKEVQDAKLKVAKVADAKPEESESKEIKPTETKQEESKSEEIKPEKTKTKKAKKKRIGKIITVRISI